MQRLSNTRWLLAALAVVLLMMLGLWAAGRVAWYEHGFRLFTTDAWTDETSQDLFDPYSFTHFMHGVLFYAAARYLFPRATVMPRLFFAVLVEVGWELLENSPLIINRYRTATAALGYTGDSILNSCGDVISCVIGFVAAYKLPVWGTILVVLGLELGLLLLIRDNLLLNVWMILWPNDAIRQWQSGH